MLKMNWIIKILKEQEKFLKFSNPDDQFVVDETASDEEYDYGLILETVPKHFDEVWEERDDELNDDEILWVPRAPDYYDYQVFHDTDLFRDILDDDSDETLLEYDTQYDEDDFVEEAKTLQMKIEEIYTRNQIFNIILLIGVSLICVVTFFALVTLIVAVITRKCWTSNNNNSEDNNNNSNGVRQIKLRSTGIIKSYSKVPVEIKNMLPSNIAYKQLYEV